MSTVTVEEFIELAEELNLELRLTPLSSGLIRDCEGRCPIVAVFHRLVYPIYEDDIEEANGAWRQVAAELGMTMSLAESIVEAADGKDTECRRLLVNRLVKQQEGT